MALALIDGHNEQFSTKRLGQLVSGVLLFSLFVFIYSGPTTLNLPDHLLHHNRISPFLGGGGRFRYVPGDFWRVCYTFLADFFWLQVRSINYAPVKIVTNVLLSLNK